MMPIAAVSYGKEPLKIDTSKNDSIVVGYLNPVGIQYHASILDFSSPVFPLETSLIFLPLLL